jgi:hypothetical protein
MGEFFCRGICGNPCESISHLQLLFDSGTPATLTIHFSCVCSRQPPNMIRVSRNAVSVIFIFCSHTLVFATKVGLFVARSPALIFSFCQDSHLVSLEPPLRGAS